MPTLQHVHSDPATTSQSRLPLAGFSVRLQTLLLVEDSRLAAEAIRLMCRKMGLRLRRTDSLAAAKMHLRVYQPDFALIDLGLPDGSGLELIACLARSTSRPSRIIAISGDDRLEAPALELGADAFLLKPFRATAHLTRLFGFQPSQLPDAISGQTAPLSRNSGADPLALRDDLRRAADLISSAKNSDDRRYALQFLSSIGHSLCDAALIRLSQDANPNHALRVIEDRLADTPDL